MATGMEMLLKSMGFDPDEIKGQMAEAKGAIDAQVKIFTERLNRIESKIDTLQAAVDRKDSE